MRTARGGGGLLGRRTDGAGSPRGASQGVLVRGTPRRRGRGGGGAGQGRAGQAWQGRLPAVAGWAGGFAEGCRRGQARSRSSRGLGVSACQDGARPDCQDVSEKQDVAACEGGRWRPPDIGHHRSTEGGDRSVAFGQGFGAPDQFWLAGRWQREGTWWAMLGDAGRC